MPEPLWKIRQRKGMSVNQLAAKSGVPAISIIEYESGHTVRSADLPKLAKALYVEEWDIEIEAKPAPKRPKTRAPSPSSVEEPRSKTAKPAARKRPARSQLARPSQIEHLLALTVRHFGVDRSALESECGKPLEQLTRREASDLLNRYQKLLAESGEPAASSEGRVKRKRAYLPEGVDQFELQYLQTQQDSEALLYFTLFDGQKLSGYVVGFSPYSITIREAETGDEVTLQKLAIAYYRLAKPQHRANDPAASETGDVS